MASAAFPDSRKFGVIRTTWHIASFGGTLPYDGACSKNTGLEKTRWFDWAPDLRLSRSGVFVGGDKCWLICRKYPKQATSRCSSHNENPSSETQPGVNVCAHEGIRTPNLLIRSRSMTESLYVKFYHPRTLRAVSFEAARLVPATLCRLMSVVNATAVITPSSHARITGRQVAPGVGR